MKPGPPCHFRLGINSMGNASALTATEAVGKIRPLVVAFGIGSAVMHNNIAVHAGWRLRRSGGILFSIVLLGAAGGCLSLGGRTTYVQASPETDARIRGLETRVSALEQAATTRAAPPLPLGRGEPIIGQANPPRSPLSSHDQASGGPARR